jgi:antitoxin ParD1/3/4
MNVSLSVELERLVQEKLDSGLYQSASEVVREALRLLEERDQLRATRLDALRSVVAAGLDQIDRGLVRDFDECAVERIQRAGRDRLTATKRR